MASEFTEEEIANLVSAFKDLRVKPKADSAEDLKRWMKEFAASSGEPEVKKEPGEELGKGPTPQTVTVSQFPRLSNFHGDGKGGISYELWKYELQCLISENRSDSVVLQSVRTSLKGEAGKVIMRLGATATVDNILSKMDSIYGDVDKTEMVLGKFYSARQQPDEDVSSWGCRLEDLLSLAINKGQVHLSDTDGMLRSMFWNGMQQYLKSITGHLYEGIHVFDELRVAIRRVEQDYRQRTDEEKSTKKSNPAKSAVASDHSTTDKLTGMVNQLAADVRAMKDQQQDGPSSRSHQQPYSRSRQQHHRSSFHDSRGGQHQNYSARRWTDIDEQGDAARDDGLEEPTCWRCGQTGHLQYGCRVQLDHQRRKPLNSRKSAPRGKR